MILNDQKFKKISSDNKGGAFVVNLSHNRNHYCENNLSRSNLKSRIELANKEYFYYHEMDYIQYTRKKMKEDLANFKQFKKSKGKEAIFAIAIENNEYNVMNVDEDEEKEKDLFKMNK